MSQTAAELNAATEKSLAARTADAAPRTKAPSRATRAASKAANGKAAAPKTAPPAKAAPAAKATPAPRKAMTPKERAAKPVTQTIADYVSWLEKNVTGRLTAEQKHLAGISITLYGSYQASPERRAARASK